MMNGKDLARRYMDFMADCDPYGFDADHEDMTEEEIVSEYQEFIDNDAATAKQCLKDLIDALDNDRTMMETAKELLSQLKLYAATPHETLAKLMPETTSRLHDFGYYRAMDRENLFHGDHSKAQAKELKERIIRYDMIIETYINALKDSRVIDDDEAFPLQIYTRKYGDRMIECMESR